MAVPTSEPFQLVRDVEVKSPCNGICTLDIQDVCKGCKRTRAEISTWYVMSNAEKQQVVARFKK